MNPSYPVYVISKGRWDSRYTSKALESINVPHHIVVEPQEYYEYAKVINPQKILTLPFSNLGQSSIPARNWVWEHSLNMGFDFHWILDDNIRGFYRMTQNIHYRVTDGTIFKCSEDFVNRYENIDLAGFQYKMFAPRKNYFNPFVLNTRIYSCILIKNSLPFRWRGRYNEDTDLSLRVLKDDRCTVLFNSFLQEKLPTMQLKGGNTDELYRQDKNFDGRLEMARSLQRQHPDCTRVVWKYNRWQHSVNYSRWRGNKPKLKPGINLEEIPKVNNYGMELRYDPQAGDLK